MKLAGRLANSALLLGAVACSDRPWREAVVGGERMLLGEISPALLFDRYPEFRESFEEYAPDDETVETIRRVDGPLNVTLYLGTWCDDSKLYAPPLLRTLREIGREDWTLQIIALDRSKRDPEGRAERHGVTFVPTAIFHRNGIELGRIVEVPVETVEKDWLRILNAAHGGPETRNP